MSAVVLSGCADTREGKDFFERQLSEGNQDDEESRNSENDLEEAGGTTVKLEVMLCSREAEREGEGVEGFPRFEVA